ncbi:hypothetical protein AC579_1034 [Pseudocercospora musae]|uniref:Uncharacterized protein n=1 Tax=Pseudocercospora musae TaxID=113226 RepID=A0A139I6V1_9PEZI|nr:hypothetical protein AC579_1034 [Pseudocercospora musae]
MAGMLDTLYSTSGFTSENSLSGHTHTHTRTHTPPYTPSRPLTSGKRSRVERSDSPASHAGSIHPTDTVSPRKKPNKRIATDNIRVEELAEGDAGYMGDLDVVNPDEVEEIDSSDADSLYDQNTASDDDTEAEKLTRKMSQVRFGDDRDAVFERTRQRRSREKRADSRLFKRSHSQSVKSETEVTDFDAMPDQDRESTRRRLRRRTKGPDDADFIFDELPRSSPSAGRSPEACPQRPIAVSTDEVGSDFFSTACASIDQHAKPASRSGTTVYHLRRLPTLLSAGHMFVLTRRLLRLRTRLSRQQRARTDVHRSPHRTPGRRRRALDHEACFTPIILGAA